MKFLHDLKIRTRLLVGFSLIIILALISGLAGLGGILRIHEQERISTLVDRCLVDAQDAQIYVEKFLNYQNPSHMEGAFQELQNVIDQVNVADADMELDRNRENVSRLVGSIRIYRESCRELMQNREELNSSSADRIRGMDDMESFLVEASASAGDFLKIRMAQKKDHSESIAILRGLQDLDNLFSQLEREILKSEKAVTEEDKILLFIETDALAVQMAAGLSDLQQAVEDTPMWDSLEKGKKALSAFEVLFGKYKEDALTESRLVRSLEKEADNVKFHARTIRNGVNENIQSIITKRRALVIILSVASVLIGILTGSLITFSLTKRLGGEPYEIEAVTSRIAGRDFSVTFPDRPLTGIFSSIQDMASALEKTTASRDELEREKLKREEEERSLNNVLNSMIEGFANHEIILNEEGVPVDYRFLYVNPAYEKIVGVQTGNLIGKTVQQVFPQTEDYWIKNFGEVALTGKSIRFENYFDSLKKYYSVSAFSPVKGQFSVSFVDITDRVLAEKDLEKKNELLSVTLKSIGDGVITTDAEGCITFLNPVTEMLTGWSNEEASGLALEQVFHIVNEFSNERCDNPAEKVLATGQVIELANHTSLISRHGQRYIIEDSAAPIKDHNGDIQGVVIIFRDSTEKSKLRDTAARNQKLESLGILAGGIAHDFNNYLTGIFGYVELVRNRLNGEQAATEICFLDKVMKISDNARALTQQLMTFAKGGDEKRDVTALEDIIHSSINFSLRGSNLLPHIRIDEDLKKCFCNRNQIAQCVDNLMINAVQAMPEGGELSIMARNVDSCPHLQDEGPFIKLEISDTGSGIPEEIREKIFDPFFSTKAEGHGLGLATVHSIIKNHDGRIDMASEEGRGTTFTIYLPSTDSEIHNEIHFKKDSVAGEGHILILDDQEYINDILKESLISLGYVPIVTSTSQEALEKIRNHKESGKEIRACILDQTLPGDDPGHVVAAKIRKINEDVVLFASSGYAESEVMRHPTKYHFADCIKKPFESEKLHNMLSRHLGRT